MRRTVRSALFLAEVWLLAAAIRLALWTLPFATVQRLAWRWGRPSRYRGTARLITPYGRARAVRCVARFVPRASCLTQALAAQVLLSRAGLKPRLRFGLAHDEAGQLRAHAWLENMGEVVIGGEGLDGFVPLPAMEET